VQRSTYSQVSTYSKSDGASQSSVTAIARPPWRPVPGPRPAAFYRTQKSSGIESAPPSVTTWTIPLLAATGTVVVIKELETTVKTAGVPLNLTLVAARATPVATTVGGRMDAHRTECDAARMRAVAGGGWPPSLKCAADPAMPARHFAATPARKSSAT
jgi:hypothetical protein